MSTVSQLVKTQFRPAKTVTIHSTLPRGTAHQTCTIIACRLTLVATIPSTPSFPMSSIYYSQYYASIETAAVAEAARICEYLATIYVGLHGLEMQQYAVSITPSSPVSSGPKRATKIQTPPQKIAASSPAHNATAADELRPKKQLARTKKTAALAKKNAANPTSSMNTPNQTEQSKTITSTVPASVDVSTRLVRD